MSDESNVYCRLHKGHNIVSMDEDYPLDCSRVLAERGTIKVDGGYRFSRDIRVKEVNSSANNLLECLFL